MSATVAISRLSLKRLVRSVCLCGSLFEISPQEYLPTPDNRPMDEDLAAGQPLRCCPSGLPSFGTHGLDL